MDSKEGVSVIIDRIFRVCAQKHKEGGNTRLEYAVWNTEEESMSHKNGGCCKCDQRGLLWFGLAAGTHRPTGHPQVQAQFQSCLWGPRTGELPEDERL